MKHARLLLGALAVVAASMLGTGSLAAQSNLDAAQAQPFFGIWQMTLETIDGTFPITMTISEREGKVAAVLGSADGQVELTDLSRTEESLVVRYNMDYQGMELPVVIHLSPDGDNLTADWDFADGMYAVSATATPQS